MEETTKLATNLKEITHTLNAHLEKTLAISENSMSHRIESLQQRVVETTNSYFSLTKEISETKMPHEDNADEFRGERVSLLEEDENTSHY